MRLRAGACESVSAPSTRAASRAPLTRRARVHSLAGPEECGELLRTSFSPSWTRPDRFSFRWLRKVRAGLNTHLAPHAHFAHRARRSRPSFGARAPRSASHPKRCPGTGAHARSRPTCVQLKDAAIWTASLAELALEMLLHSGFPSWGSGTKERRRAIEDDPCLWTARRRRHRRLRLSLSTIFRIFFWNIGGV